MLTGMLAQNQNYRQYLKITPRIILDLEQAYNVS